MRQIPIEGLTPEEAFLLSGTPYFGSSAMRFYATDEIRAKVLYKAEWLVHPDKPNTATMRRA